jgi:hypothetical protein
LAEDVAVLLPELVVMHVVAETVDFLIDVGALVDHAKDGSANKIAAEVHVVIGDQAKFFRRLFFR